MFLSWYVLDILCFPLIMDAHCAKNTKLLTNIWFFHSLGHFLVIATSWTQQTNACSDWYEARTLVRQQQHSYKVESLYDFIIVCSYHDMFLFHTNYPADAKLKALIRSWTLFVPAASVNFPADFESIRTTSLKHVRGTTSRYVRSRRFVTLQD